MMRGEPDQFQSARPTSGGRQHMPLFSTVTHGLLDNMYFRFWWVRIKALAEQRDWNELEKFSRSKKSPIGYEVYK